MCGNLSAPVSVLKTRGIDMHRSVTKHAGYAVALALLGWLASAARAQDVTNPKVLNFGQARQWPGAARRLYSLPAH